MSPIRDLLVALPSEIYRLRLRNAAPRRRRGAQPTAACEVVVDRGEQSSVIWHSWSCRPPGGRGALVIFPLSTVSTQTR